MIHCRLLIRIKMNWHVVYAVCSNNAFLPHTLRPESPLFIFCPTLTAITTMTQYVIGVVADGGFHSWLKCSELSGNCALKAESLPPISHSTFSLFSSSFLQPAMQICMDSGPRVPACVGCLWKNSRTKADIRILKIISWVSVGWESMWCEDKRVGGAETKSPLMKLSSTVWHVDMVPTNYLGLCIEGGRCSCE